MVTKQSMVQDIHSIADGLEMDTNPLLGFALVLIRATENETHFDCLDECTDELSQALVTASGEVLED
jgi:hypothetical protein